MRRPHVFEAVATSHGVWVLREGGKGREGWKEVGGRGGKESWKGQYMYMYIHVDVRLIPSGILTAYTE